MLYDFNMNYYGRKDVNDPHSSIRYFPEENSYFHMYSLKEVGRSFSLHDLAKYMSLKDYLTLPNAELEVVLEGILAGEKERTERQGRNNPGNRKGLTTEEKELDKLLKQYGEK